MSQQVVKSATPSTENPAHPTVVQVRHEGERVSVVCEVVDGDELAVYPLRWIRFGDDRRFPEGGRAGEESAWQRDEWPEGLKVLARKYARLKVMRGEVDGVCR